MAFIPVRKNYSRDGVKGVAISIVSKVGKEQVRLGFNKIFVKNMKWEADAHLLIDVDPDRVVIWIRESTNGGYTLVRPTGNGGSPFVNFSLKKQVPEIQDFFNKTIRDRVELDVVGNDRGELYCGFPGITRKEVLESFATARKPVSKTDKKGFAIG